MSFDAFYDAGRRLGDRLPARRAMSWNQYRQWVKLYDAGRTSFYPMPPSSVRNSDYTFKKSFVKRKPIKKRPWWLKYSIL